MDKLAKQLAKKAKSLNICKEWHGVLKTLEDKHEMVKMYLDGIDFCLSNDYPDNDFIKKHFSDVASEHGVFVDKEIDIANPSKCVALGSTNGKITVDGYTVSEVFVKHDSDIFISAEDSAFVMVDVFDSSRTIVHTSGNAKVCINRYGNARIEKHTKEASMVKVIEKHKKTY